MKTTVFKSILFIVLITSFGKLRAQSDQVFADLKSSGNVNALMGSATEPISIGNVIENSFTHTSTIKIKCTEPVTMKVKIFTMNGDLAKEEIQPLTSGINELNLDADMADLSAGSYMIQLYTNEGSALRRIVKTNN